MWDGVEEKFRKKLAMWKRQHIAKGGRLTLIRNTPSNLPIYLMSLVRMPRGVSTRLEKITKGFPLGEQCFRKEDPSDKLEAGLLKQSKKGV